MEYHGHGINYGRLWHIHGHGHGINYGNMMAYYANTVVCHGNMKVK